MLCKAIWNAKPSNMARCINLGTPSFDELCGIFCLFILALLRLKTMIICQGIFIFHFMDMQGNEMFLFKGFDLFELRLLLI